MAREPFAARLTCIWIGAIFNFAIRGFRGNIHNQFKEENNSRNFWTGFVITIIALIAFMYLVFIRPHLQIRG